MSALTYKLYIYIELKYQNGLSI